jgi:hypothetical protein
MWLPSSVLDLFRISIDQVTDLRTDLAVLRAERDTLKAQLVKQEILSDWFRLQVNSLQLERAALLEKAYDIRVPVPSIQRATPPPEFNLDSFSFDDLGNEMAKKLGLPQYPTVDDN